jgi:acetyl esterase
MRTAIRDRAVHLRRRVGATLTDSFFRGASALGRLHPAARYDRHGVECLPDVSYGDGRPEHAHRRLDVYRPIDRDGPRPVVLYIHGGGFRILSKDTHWLMGLAFARRGYVVLNIDYRLAPAHPFPAALLDVAAAYRWVLAHAERYGGDPSRLVVAGESAGANLSTALTLLTCYERPEPWAREVFEVGRVPDAVVPACGIFQVSDVERFAGRVSSSFVMDRLREVSEAYLGVEGSGPRTAGPGPLDLADPVVLLERRQAPARPLPPFFAPVGSRDPLRPDNDRLAAALRGLGVCCEAPVYPGERHAFHAFVFRAQARRCWRDTFAFLERQGVR